MQKQWEQLGTDIISAHKGVLSECSLVVSKEHVGDIVRSAKQNLHELDQLLQEKDTPLTVFEQKRADKVLAAAILDVCEMFVAKDRPGPCQNVEIRRQSLGMGSPAFLELPPLAGGGMRQDSDSNRLKQMDSLESRPARHDPGGTYSFPTFSAVGGDETSPCTPMMHLTLSVSSGGSGMLVPFHYVQSNAASPENSATFDTVDSDQLLEFVAVAEALDPDSLTSEEFSSLGITYSVPVFRRFSLCYSAEDPEPLPTFENLIPNGANIPVAREDYKKFLSLLRGKVAELGCIVSDET